MNRSGFSLIELSIVMCLALLLVSIISINTNFLNKYTATSELHLLHATCTHLQQCALTEKAEQKIILDSINQAYSYNGHQHKLSGDIEFGVLPNAKGPPSSPQNTLHSAVTFTDNTITFYPDGIIQSGTLYLKDTKNNSLYALSSPISSVSFLRKYRYDGKWHLME